MTSLRLVWRARPQAHGGGSRRLDTCSGVVQRDWRAQPPLRRSSDRGSARVISASILILSLHPLARHELGFVPLVRAPNWTVVEKVSAGRWPCRPSQRPLRQGSLTIDAGQGSRPSTAAGCVGPSILVVPRYVGLPGRDARTGFGVSAPGTRLRCSSARCCLARSPGGRQATSSQVPVAEFVRRVLQEAPAKRNCSISNFWTRCSRPRCWSTTGARSTTPTDPTSRSATSRRRSSPAGGGQRTRFESHNRWTMTGARSP
jgi:hypothetical protein